jgi:hypothetical protein
VETLVPADDVAAAEECVLAAVVPDAEPAVRAVRLSVPDVSPALHRLEEFARSCADSQFDSCRNGSCRRCMSSAVSVLVEEP